LIRTAGWYHRPGDILAAMPRLVCAIALLLVCTACAVGRPPSVESRAQQIEGRVWSPYCPGRLLIDCSTKQARELRTEIEGRVEAGQGQEEILRWIRLNFGDEALAAPSGSTTALVWSFPIAVVVIGGAILAVLIRRWSRRGAIHAGT
jgi:cytochrome c-type biogenesis protein CcmH